MYFWYCSFRSSVSRRVSVFSSVRNVRSGHSPSTSIRRSHAWIAAARHGREQEWWENARVRNWTTRNFSSGVKSKLLLEPQSQETNLMLTPSHEEHRYLYRTPIAAFTFMVQKVTIHIFLELTIILECIKLNYVHRILCNLFWNTHSA